MDLQKDEKQQKSIFVDEDTQKELNAPIQNPNEFDAEERKFMATVLDLIENKKIELHTPSTLLNRAVYDTLSDEKKGEIDLEAINLLSAIRQIKDLHDAGFGNSYQMQNQVEALKNTKERIEDVGGDVFII